MRCVLVFPFQKICKAASFLLFCCLFTSTYANISSVQLKHFSAADGLSQSTVADVVEDKNGFMWFATTDGLNRFDGYNFTHYYHTSGTDSLAGNFIRHLLVDHDGHLWVATDRGLSRYIEKRDAFVNYDASNSNLNTDEIWAITSTPEDHLLVATATRLFRFDKTNERFKEITPTGQALPHYIVTLYAETSRTWIGSYGGGLYLLDNTTGQLHDLRSNNPWQVSIDADYLFDVKKIHDQYWLGTETGAYVLDKSLNISTHFSTRSKMPLAGDKVRAIELAADGNLWLGTSGGVSILDLNNHKVFSIDAKNHMHAGLHDRFILDIYRDSHDSIWLGTMSKGVHQYHDSFADVKTYNNIFFNQGKLSSSVIWSFQETGSGNIWIATQSNGVSEFSPQTGTFRHYLSDFGYFIFEMAVDDSGKIWLGTNGGLFVFERQGDALKQTRLFYPGETVYQLNFLAGSIWVGVSHGMLTSIDPDTYQIDKVKLTSPGLTELFPLHSDTANKLWLKTNLGLAVYDRQTRQLNQIVLQSVNEYPMLLSVFETDGMIWVATAADGILGLDKTTYKVKKTFNQWWGKEAPTYTNAILAGNAVWMSEKHSIDEISLLSGEKIGEISEALLGYNDLAEGASLKTKQGDILFGGTKGMHIFDPRKLHKRAFQADIPPMITGLNILNHPVRMDSRSSVLQRPIHLTKTLALANDASPFSLEFAQVNNLNSHILDYRYRLLGLSKKWLETDADNRLATYTNLMFGDYVFEVQSRFKDGDWSPPAKLDIKIKPPFWLHQHMLILYAVCLLVLLLYWLRQYRAKRAGQLAVEQSEERLKLSLWSSGDELWDWDIYLGQVFRANTWGTVDFPQDDIRANSAYQANIHPDDMVKVQKALRLHLDMHTDHYETAYRVKTYKGQWIWLLDRGKVVHWDSNSQPLRMTGTLKNISHMKKAEEQLKLYQRSFETISDGVFIANTEFRFISVNQSYCRTTGETQEQALASYLRFYQYPDAFTEEVKKSLQQKGNWFGEIESRRKNGEKYEMELNIDAIQGEDGKISHYVGVFSDISTRKNTEKELLKLANIDPLTEMPNRSLFQASHQNMVRKNTSHALLCLDMDNFKKINDSLGHQAGDLLIKQIGKRLQKIAGTLATCYRLGGDEFSILIDDAEDMRRITHLAQRVLDDMSRPFLINRQEFVLSASLGIAFYPEDGENSQELLKNADTAMYFAKNAGGNRYQFFSGEMNQNAVRQLQIENLIRYGLKQDLFTLFYQPKVDIASGKLVSMEALVRFEHPEKGIVSPAQFIPLAEQTGQIIEIGEQVLRKACEDTKRWVQEGLFTGRVAINISARQFELPDLDERIAKTLRQVGLSPLHLECEITEGTLMQNPDQALRMMDRLRERGIHLALDDFGTGYSSLAYLKRFPLNTLKIDKAFIDDIATSNVDKHMTAAIIRIAHNLGLKVVAEGVEQEEQLSILRHYQCEMLQGYLYSKPLSSTRFERLLRENRHMDKLIRQSNKH